MGGTAGGTLLRPKTRHAHCFFSGAHRRRPILIGGYPFSRRTFLLGKGDLEGLVWFHHGPDTLVHCLKRGPTEACRNARRSSQDARRGCRAAILGIRHPDPIPDCPGSGLKLTKGTVGSDASRLWRLHLPPRAAGWPLRYLAICVPRIIIARRAWRRWSCKLMPMEKQYQTARRPAPSWATPPHTGHCPSLDKATLGDAGVIPISPAFPSQRNSSETSLARRRGLVADRSGRARQI